MTFLNARAIIQMHFFISELTERSPGTQEGIFNQDRPIENSANEIWDSRK